MMSILLILFVRFFSALPSMAVSGHVAFCLLFGLLVYTLLAAPLIFPASKMYNAASSGQRSGAAAPCPARSCTGRALPAAAQRAREATRAPPWRAVLPHAAALAAQIASARSAQYGARFVTVFSVAPAVRIHSGSTQALGGISHIFSAKSAKIQHRFKRLVICITH